MESCLLRAISRYAEAMLNHELSFIKIRYSPYSFAEVRENGDKMNNKLYLFVALIALLLLSCNQHEFTNLVDSDVEFPVPYEIRIYRTGLSSCLLRWCYDEVGSESGFILERRIAGGNWQIITEPHINVREYEDSGLVEGNIYEYRLYSYYYESTSNKVIISYELISVTDIDDNVYQVIKIGDQYWMAENLKVTHYRNGNPITNLTSSNDWTNTNNEAYCVYNNNSSNADTYGNLYNWYAVDNSRGLPPEGWHVPSDEEIKQLEMYIGMSESEANSIEWRGTNEGSKLADRDDLWSNGSLETDADFGDSGFSFLPGGYRSSNVYGSYYDINNKGCFWSSTDGSSDTAWSRGLNHSNSKVGRIDYNKNNGFSVRCIRD